jgi:UDP-hydrolysing UDP-N-acetyl-D-glucosamine 2-epimerase
VTGSRADYGLWTSTLRAISCHPNLRLQLVVTGMHLLKKFGSTVNEIRRDGWPIAARIRMQSGDDGPADQAQGLARGVDGMARFFLRERTDVVMVLGDRIEALAGALAGVTTGRFVAHVHGGDVAPGDVDGCLRNSITKLAHLHFTATAAARRRVIAMGENPSTVFQVGAPGLDDLFALLPSCPKPKMRTGRALIVFHPTGRSPEAEGRAVRHILEAARRANLVPLIVYPNSDRGHQGIVDVIERYQETSKVIVLRSMRRDVYLRYLIESDVLIGNSSSGMIEAAAAGTPVVNVGDRQLGREREHRLVVDTSESVDSICSGIERVLRKRIPRPSNSIYGQGNAGRTIAKWIARVPLTERLRRKIASSPGKR